MVLFISAISEVEFYMWLGSILNLVLLVALLFNNPGIRGLALKPLMRLCLTFQCDMEAGASPLVTDYHQVCSRESSRV